MMQCLSNLLTVLYILIPHNVTLWSQAQCYSANEGHRHLLSFHRKWKYFTLKSTTRSNYSLTFACILHCSSGMLQLFTVRLHGLCSMKSDSMKMTDGLKGHTQTHSVRMIWPCEGRELEMDGIEAALSPTLSKAWESRSERAICHEADWLNHGQTSVKSALTPQGMIYSQQLTPCIPNTLWTGNLFLASN